MLACPPGVRPNPDPLRSQVIAGDDYPTENPMTANDPDDSWAEYYQKVADRAPRELFRRLMALVEAGAPDAPRGQAIDLGCGDGTETLALLAAGWHVLAVDSSPAAIRLVAERARPLDAGRFQTQLAAFDEVILPPADLLYAGLSLPFCPPAQFSALWCKIRAALRPGAWLAAHFFGVRDSWASNTAMSFHTVEALHALLAGLTIVQWQEVEDDRPSAFEAMKHFHYFEVIARRSDSGESRHAGRGH